MDGYSVKNDNIKSDDTSKRLKQMIGSTTTHKFRTKAKFVRRTVSTKRAFGFTGRTSGLESLYIPKEVIDSVAYKYYVNNNQSNKFDEKGMKTIHGVDHAKMVLDLSFEFLDIYKELLSLSGQTLEPDYDTLAVLSLAAIGHDSGRVNEEADLDEVSSAELLYTYGMKALEKFIPNIHKRKMILLRAGIAIISKSASMTEENKNRYIRCFVTGDGLENIPPYDKSVKVKVPPSCKIKKEDQDRIIKELEEITKRDSSNLGAIPQKVLQCADCADVTRVRVASEFSLEALVILKDANYLRKEGKINEEQLAIIKSRVNDLMKRLKLKQNKSYGKHAFILHRLHEIVNDPVFFGTNKTEEGIRRTQSLRKVFADGVEECGINDDLLKCCMSNMTEDLKLKDQYNCGAIKEIIEKLYKEDMEKKQEEARQRILLEAISFLPESSSSSHSEKRKLWHNFCIKNKLDPSTLSFFSNKRDGKIYIIASRITDRAKKYFGEDSKEVRDFVNYFCDNYAKISSQVSVGHAI